MDKHELHLLIDSGASDDQLHEAIDRLEVQKVTLNVTKPILEELVKNPEFEVKFSQQLLSKALEKAGNTSSTYTNIDQLAKKLHRDVMEKLGTNISILTMEGIRMSTTKVVQKLEVGCKTMLTV